MTLAVAFALPMLIRAIVRAYLHVAGLTGPHGVAGARAFDTHTVAGTVDMGVPARGDALVYTRYHYVNLVFERCHCDDLTPLY